ncbi:PREDICTED: uncharacterized protein LOC109153882 isoform X2 [Ipomoea nil]|uniref:uncharacterized protein LOC109153882 isoform X2 n=1 Tax=Ipomoea nil TaxID=35883 RepID=UPI0009013F93|nr:PREDICTED: uncharacterized protein LOC109153882 isoform X2 [Ipomoea nil]
MVSHSTLPLIHGSLKLSTKLFSSFHFHSSAVNKHGFGSRQQTRFALQRTKSSAVRLLANPNGSPGKERAKKEVVMVDPLEAKQLAAKQMEAIKTKQRFKRRREIEAINGAWAMIGLTAGLVIEGHTGKSIIDQLAGYLAAVVGFFIR